MLKNLEGKQLTSPDLQRIRVLNARVMGKSARAANLACGANMEEPDNFLLKEDRCCYCGVGRIEHLSHGTLTPVELEKIKAGVIPHQLKKQRLTA